MVKSSAPLVTVILPTYNRSELILRAVDSVLNQDFQNFELIVVDDGSEDHTFEALAVYGDRLSILRQAHAGVSRARNTGLSRARGHLIAFLDSDDWWLPRKLSAQVHFFENHPEAVICQTEERWVRNGKRVNPGKRHEKPWGEAFFRSLHLCLISPSAVMIRRAVFDEVGRFDESLPACEDYDLWLRVTARWPVYTLGEPLIVKTGGHGDQLSRTTIALDRYRIQAIRKILDQGVLDPDQARAAKKVLTGKAEIYGQGCLKRGKTEEGERYLTLADEYRV